MTTAQAQADLRRAFVGGGPGVGISGLVWLTAAAVAARSDVATAFAPLFVGGMLIFPLAIAIARLGFRRAAPATGNPLGPLALESTVAMIGGLFAAWLFLRYQPGFVFPLAAIAIGTHYAVFKTVYGDRLYWVLGALITGVGLLDILAAPPPGGTILAVAAIELAFGAVLTVRALRA